MRLSLPPSLPGGAPCRGCFIHKVPLGLRNNYLKGCQCPAPAHWVARGPISFSVLLVSCGGSGASSHLSFHRQQPPCPRTPSPDTGARGASGLPGGQPHPEKTPSRLNRIKIHKVANLWGQYLKVTLDGSPRTSSTNKAPTLQIPPPHAEMPHKNHRGHAQVFRQRNRTSLGSDRFI